MGLGSELQKLAGLTTGFFAGFRYYQQVGDWVSQRTFLSVEWGSVVALTAIVVLSYLLVTRTARLLEKLIQVNFEKKVNQIGGLVAGLGRGLLVSSVVLVACQQLPTPAMQESIRKHSLSGPVVLKMAPAVYDRLRVLPRRALARLGAE